MNEFSREFCDIMVWYVLELEETKVSIRTSKERLIESARLCAKCWPSRMDFLMHSLGGGGQFILGHPGPDYGIRKASS